MYTVYRANLLTIVNHDYSLTIPNDRGITISVEETLLNVLGAWGVCMCVRGGDGRQGAIVACFASGSK